jgi:hypothetical protein
MRMNGTAVVIDSLFPPRRPVDCDSTFRDGICPETRRCRLARFGRCLALAKVVRGVLNQPAGLNRCHVAKILLRRQHKLHEATLIRSYETVHILNRKVTDLLRTLRTSLKIR